jgi:hypothetical protein
MTRNSNISITLATQRSGTKLLGNCFNNGSELLSLGEIFHDNSIGMHSFSSFSKNYEKFLEFYTKGKIFDLLDHYFNELILIKKSIHFDLMYNNLNFFSPLWSESLYFPAFFDYIKSRNICIFHLSRDVIDTYVSLLVANKSSSFHYLQSADKLRSQDQIQDFNTDFSLLDLNDFRFYAKNVNYQRNLVREFFDGYKYYLDIDYSNLINSSGFLNSNISIAIASTLDNNIQPENLQNKPVDLVKNLDENIFIELKEYLKYVAI